MTPAVEVRNLTRIFSDRHSGKSVRALNDVSLSVETGETLGIVGESGCGKSTLAKLLVRLDQPTSGTISLHGSDITSLSQRQLRSRRREIQLVFQDPYGSLNPRQTIRQCLDEVLGVHGLAVSPQDRQDRILQVLDRVGMGPQFLNRLPRHLSGGQMQRVGIARALAVEPSILVLDESVSALDVSVQAEVINLLVRLRTELNLTYIFISHDLGIVRHVSDRIAVMYLGRVVEIGPWKTVSDTPLHPYASALQKAVPIADPALADRLSESPIKGEVADPAAPPPGCEFHPRCSCREPVCSVEQPELTALDATHSVSCHLVTRRPGQPAAQVTQDRVNGPAS